jgi:hypothetical protein
MAIPRASPPPHVIVSSPRTLFTRGWKRGMLRLQRDLRALIYEPQTIASDDSNPREW